MGDDSGQGVGVDISGHVYVAGMTSGTLGAAALSDQDAFVRKYDSAKNLQWTVQFGTTDLDEVTGIAVDSSGNSYIAGSTEGILAYQAVGKDAFLVKYDSDGVQKRVKQPQTVFVVDKAWAVAVYSANSCVYVAGMTDGSLAGPNAGALDMFLIKYDLDGTELWIRQLGIVGNDVVYAVAVDGSGNVYLTGQTNGDFESYGSHQGNGDAFLVKFNSSGTRLWTKQWGTSYFDYGNGVAVGSSGNIYVTGITEGTLDGANAGGRDIFLAKYDTSGNPLWIRQTGSSNEDHSRAVTVNSGGNVYITGTTLGILSDPGNGGSDLFLVVYDSSGTLQDTVQGGSSGNDESNGIAIDPVNNCLYLTGRTDGGVDGNVNVGGWDAILIKLGFDGELL